MNDIIIKQDNSKQFNLILLAALLTAMGVFLIFQNFILFKIIGIIDTIFFGFCLTVIFYKYIKPKDILIIGENGFTDNSTLLNVGFISWEYVDDVYIYSHILSNNKCIRVKLREFNKLNIPRIKAVKYNKSLSSAEITITLQSTTAKYEDILEIMQKYLLLYSSK